MEIICHCNFDNILKLNTISAESGDDTKQMWF